MFTWPSYELSHNFDACRMDGDGPLFSLDPYVDSISYASVFHENNSGPKSEAEQ